MKREELIEQLPENLKQAHLDAILDYENTFTKAKNRLENFVQRSNIEENLGETKRKRLPKMIIKSLEEEEEKETRNPEENEKLEPIA